MLKKEGVKIGKEYINNLKLVTLLINTPDAKK